MEEGRTPVSQDSGAPTEPVEDGAAKSSHETLILPKGSGVLESARAQAEALGKGADSAAKAEESKWGARFQLALLVFAQIWVIWLLVILCVGPVVLGSLTPLVVLVVVSLAGCLISGCALFTGGQKQRSVWLHAGVRASLLSLALCAFAFLVHKTSRSSFAYLQVLGVSFEILLLCAVVSAVLRIGHRIFTQLQSRLSEWLVIVFTTGLVMAALFPLIQSEFAEGPQRAIGSAVAMVCTVILLVAGSAWAWSIAKQTGEEDGTRRIVLMAKGWLLVLGTFGAVAFVFLSMILVMDDLFALHRSEPIWYFYFGCLLTAPTAIPGLSVHRRAKRAAEAAKRRP